MAEPTPNQANSTESNRSPGLNLALFAATCFTTVYAGYLSFGSAMGGISFGGTLMTILICHEMGHYIVAKYHKIDASLPYFVPLPPQISLGTLGAVIRMRRPISDRNQLIDVGAAGPFAGLIVTLPLLLVGLERSELQPIGEGAYLEGNSLLYLAIKYAVFGQYLPTADGWDVHLHPMAFAAWVGLLITMINLIPIGQLDGGHIACAALGDRHESSSSWLHRGLVGVAAIVFAALMWEALSAGRSGTEAFWHGVKGGLPWLVWAGILAVMRRLSGGVYHPPIGQAALTPQRRIVVWFTLVVFLAILTPVPLRPALVPGT
ncbi:MAG: site-2 protease family protein [Proteobacteria bacterium]|nr:site-2 protease family protein [Pseudomonadota bacterium]